MKNREHSEWTAKLSDYMADQLDAEERAAMDAHLAGCEACSDAHQDLVRIVTKAGALEDVQPPKDLWQGIAAGIRSADVLPFPNRQDAAARPRTLELSPRRLAAAAVVLVALSGSLSWWAGSSRGGSVPAAAPAELGSGAVAGVSAGTPGVPTGLAEELAALEEILEAARGVLDPNTVRVIESSLGVIEQAIVDSREALAQDPGNAFLTEHLERMYRRKLVYLQDALRFAELEA
jgi:anti-sigma factor RsiW